MSRLARTDEPPRFGQQSADLSVDHEKRCADSGALDGLMEDVAAADKAASLFESGRKILTRTTENAYHALAAVNCQYSMEFAELQLKAIATISESAFATLRLVEAISSSPNPSKAAEASLDHLRDRTTALKCIALDFFDSALSLIGALSLNDAICRDPEVKFPIRRREDPRPILARQCAMLTGQQRSVLRLLLAGLPNKLIAHQLGICETTVKAHVSKLLEKLNVYNRAQLIALVARYDQNAALD
jgi:DNA-binding NarL/FixJ family response regulator